MTDKSKLTVYKHNDLIEARYAAMSLHEQLLILACISSVNPLEMTAETPVELSVSAFADLADIQAAGAYTELQSAVERLFERKLTIMNPDPGDPALKRTVTRWVSSINYYDGQGRIRLYFAPKILPYLANLAGSFTKYKLQHVTQFKSKYGVRLYELLMQWQGRGSREIEIDWLRECWELTEKYPRLEALKRKVINPAINDINTYSNLWVKYGQRKRGRRVVALQFQFGMKHPEPKPSKLSKQYIEKHALPGESWEEAKTRLSA